LTQTIFRGRLCALLDTIQRILHLNPFIVHQVTDVVGPLKYSSKSRLTKISDAKSGSWFLQVLPPQAESVLELAIWWNSKARNKIILNASSKESSSTRHAANIHSAQGVHHFTSVTRGSPLSWPTSKRSALSPEFRNGSTNGEHMRLFQRLIWPSRVLTDSRDFDYNERMDLRDSMGPWFLERGYTLYRQDYEYDDIGRCTDISCQKNLTGMFDIPTVTLAATAKIAESGLLEHYLMMV
jgi:hypothetical protein